MTPDIEITTSGRGGSFRYREGEHHITFDWEFAMDPVLVLAWGPARGDWDATYPWAAGRQAAIYDAVCAEVVRQKAPESAFEYDLDSGEIKIFDASASRGKRRAK
jgi:hypothetical protein